MSNDQGKKTKFVPIYSQDGKAAEAVQLPGKFYAPNIASFNQNVLLNYSPVLD